MDRWSRRQALGGIVALSALACGGNPLKAAKGEKPPKDAGDRERPQPRAPAPVDTSGMKASTLFVPEAADRFRNLKFADTPAWMRRTPAWWVPEAETAGSGMMQFIDSADPDLRDRVKSFRDLPVLLEGARRFGTDTVYLVDWFQPGGDRDRAHPPQFQGKGDWVPGPDLGGGAALKEGTAALQAKGGKIILYMEGFLVSQKSKVGVEHGRDWCIKDEKGPIDYPYPTGWMMCPACKPWVEYCAASAARIVGEYGANGVFVDSIGIQGGYRCMDRSHGHKLNDPAVFDEGCVDLMRAIRKAIRAKDPESVILCEGPKVEPMFEFVDGTQDWGLHKLVTRPVWDAVAGTDIQTAGWSLDDMHQILALGSKVVLGETWNQRPDGPSAAAMLDRKLGGKMPDDKKALRDWLDRVFKDFHKFRNAAIVLGLAVPGVDDATPRHADDDRFLKDDAQVKSILQQLRRYAQELDGVLAGKDLPAPADHMRKLVDARAALVPYCDEGGRVSRVVAQGAQAAWRFDSPKGTAFTAVNVGNPAVTIELPVTGAWVDAVSGERIASTNRITVPGHALRVLLPA